MAGHASDHDEEHSAHDEPWLVSYADMMTLLFGFFVLMYSFASKEKSEEWERVRKDLAKYFGGQYISPYEQLDKGIKKVLDKSSIANGFETASTSDGLEILFHSNFLFESGKADLSKNAAEPMKALAELILDRKEFIRLTIEGHTDDSPISTEKFPSNWELSGARAASVVRLFEALGFPAEHLQASAFGSTRPLVPNRGPDGKVIPENQARNRRVVLKLVTRSESQSEGETPRPEASDEVHGANGASENREPVAPTDSADPAS
jgi:chemotaxis protein MotB